MRSALLVTDSNVWTAETEYAVAVARAEASMGAKVTFLAPSGSPVMEHGGEMFRILELPGSEPAGSPADFLADTRFVASLTAGESFDVVHSSRSTAHLMAALSTGTRAPLVHLRGGAKVPNRSVWNRCLYRQMTDAVVVSSARIELWVKERLGVAPGRVHRLLAPVGAEWFAPADDQRPLRPELGLPERSRLVVCVGRLAPVKGHRTLIRAMSVVMKREKDVALVLVGEAWSGEPAGLRGLAESLGIGDSVFFAGRREDVRRFVDQSSVCVSSSVGSEENSRAVSEYMAAGRPVVATRVGVIPELVEDGLTGSLVDPDDHTAMADAIVELLRDRKAAELIGRAGHAAAARTLSPSAFIDGLGRALRASGIPGR